MSLSVVGSFAYVGGRFNTGTGVNTQVSSFPALYLAEDKNTALQEHLGQEPVSHDSKLTTLELALTNPSSETIACVSGKMDKVFDLTKPDNLKPFVELIKNFKFSKSLSKNAKKLQAEIPGIITKAEVLHETLIDYNWRQLPSNYDIPSNSQIFGQLISTSGIEGILYRSKFTNKHCLAIYPRNFIGTDSYIELVDDVPHPSVPRKIDASNWRISELNAGEIIQSE